MFPAGSLEELGLGPNDVGLRCNPLLDVLPDGRVISCYPLATHATEQLDSVRDAKALRAAFTKRQADDRAFMLYPHCSTCEYRLSGRCTGGCLAGSLRRLRSSTATFGLPDAHREPIPDAAAATARSATPQPRPRSIPLPVLTGHVAATAAHSPCCN
jgi:radical SAM protein with 4Fe4S-binding SPASM domain